MSSNITVKKCERKEYNQFLSMLNNAFGHTAESEWFQKNISHCTPYEQDVLDYEIERHFIALCDGEVIGAVGAYPMEWVVSEDAENGMKINIKSFGIGQVSCKKENRGSGVMTNMLNAAIEEMTGEGALVGFLGGDRFRYGNFGFDFGGNSVSLHFNAYRLGTQINTSGLNVKKAEFADYKTLEMMYERLPSYIIRDEHCWEMLLKRPNYSFYIAEKEQKTAYICISEDNTAVEIQGDAEIAKAVILWAMETKNISYLKVLYPLAVYMQDPLYYSLWNAAAWVSLEPMDLAAICVPDKLFTLVAPILSKQGYGEFLGNLNTSEKTELLKKLFGFSAAPLNSSLNMFRDIKPLVFWLPQINNV